MGPAVRADFRRLYPANAKTPMCCPSDDNRTRVTNSVTSAWSLWWHVGPVFLARGSDVDGKPCCLDCCLRKTTLVIVWGDLNPCCCISLRWNKVRTCFGSTACSNYLCLLKVYLLCQAGIECAVAGILEINMVSKGHLNVETSKCVSRDPWSYFESWLKYSVPLF